MKSAWSGTACEERRTTAGTRTRGRGEFADTARPGANRSGGETCAQRITGRETRDAAADVGRSRARARAAQARGGGTGTGSVRDGATLASVTGQSAEGERKTGRVAACSARTSFSPDARSTEPGSCCLAVSLAEATLTQRWQARPGSKVAWNAVTTRMVCKFSENILPQAKTCTASSNAPLAQSQAKRRQVMENF